MQGETLALLVAKDAAQQKPERTFLISAGDLNQILTITNHLSDEPEFDALRLLDQIVTTGAQASSPDEETLEQPSGDGLLEAVLRSYLSNSVRRRDREHALSCASRLVQLYETDKSKTSKERCELYRQVGYLCVNFGQLDVAVDSFGRAYELAIHTETSDPELSFDSAHCLANAHMLSGNCSAAEQIYKTILNELVPNTAAVWGIGTAIRLGEAQLLQGNYSEARNSFHRGMEWMTDDENDLVKAERQLAAERWNSTCSAMALSTQIQEEVYERLKSQGFTLESTN